MKKQDKAKTIIFDFDGVIVDSFDVCHKLVVQFNGETSADDYRAMFHGNIYDSLKEMRSKTLLPERQDAYFSAYRDAILTHPVVPGMERVIVELARVQKLHIVSSCKGSIIKDFLKMHAIEGYFDQILGIEVHTNKTTKIQMLSSEPHNGIFITDTLGDIKEATQVGLRSIAVSWGFHGAQRLSQGNPLAIVNTPQELLAKIAQLGF